jgi:hypothetical protein
MANLVQNRAAPVKALGAMLQNLGIGAAISNRGDRITGS